MGADEGLFRVAMVVEGRDWMASSWWAWVEAFCEDRSLQKC